MADFVKLAATAKRLVEKNGREVRLVKGNRTASDPAKPWRGSDAAPTPAKGGASVTAIACFVPASGDGLGRLVQDTTGALVSAFDQVALVASDSVAGVDLTGFDKVVDRDELWRIIVRGELRPAGTSLLWVLGLKR